MDRQDPLTSTTTPFFYSFSITCFELQHAGFVFFLFDPSSSHPGRTLAVGHCSDGTQPSTRMSRNQPTSSPFDSITPPCYSPRSIFDSSPPCVRASVDGRPGLQHHPSLVHRPAPAFTRPHAYPLLSFPSSRRSSRPRTFSAPAFDKRVTTNEVERGRFTGSPGSSRCASEEGSGTRVPPVLWNSVFRAMQGTIKPSPSSTSMGRVGSRASVHSTISVASAMQFDPDDPRLTGKIKERPPAELPSK